MTLPKSEPGGDHSPTKFSISEKQGDRSACEFKTDSNPYLQNVQLEADSSFPLTTHYNPIKAIPLKNVGGGETPPPPPEKKRGGGGRPMEKKEGAGGSTEYPPFLGFSDVCLRGLKCTKRGSLRKKRGVCL